MCHSVAKNWLSGSEISFGVVPWSKIPPSAFTAMQSKRWRGKQSLLHLLKLRNSRPHTGTRVTGLVKHISRGCLPGKHTTSQGEAVARSTLVVWGAPEITVNTSHIQARNDVVIDVNRTAETIGLNTTKRYPSTGIILKHIEWAFGDGSQVVGRQEELVIITRSTRLVVCFDSLGEVDKTKRLSKLLDSVGLRGPALLDGLIDGGIEVGSW